MDKFGYIYETTNLITGKKYIGQKKSNVFLGNKYLGSGVLLYKAINKYGRENFNVRLIEWCYSKKDLNERERYWIMFYSAVSSNNYYNLSFGGNSNSEIPKSFESNLKRVQTRRANGNYNISEETRERLKESHKGYVMPQSQKDKISKALKGKDIGFVKGSHHSEETKKKMSKYWKENPQSGQFKKGCSPWNKGKEMDENFKKQMSERMKEQAKTNPPPSQKGKIWINNSKINKLIYKDELNDYINLGYKKGMKKK